MYNFFPFIQVSNHGTSIMQVTNCISRPTILQFCEKLLSEDFPFNKILFYFSLEPVGFELQTHFWLKGKQGSVESSNYRMSNYRTDFVEF